MSAGRGLALISGSALSLVACRPPPALPPPLPTPTIALSVEDLPSETRVELAIADVREVASADKIEVLVSGLVVNHGSRPTTSVLVMVRALDRDGLTLRETQVIPDRVRIPAGGGAARFSAVFPNDPAVVDYYIEAVGYGRKVAE